jgi:serine/threonine protein kinase
MELCNGGSADALMHKHGGKLPLAVAAPIMRQCLEGLEHAHRLKFIHRDLKPQNVLLEQQTGGWVAKISDFGLAKNLEQAGLSGMTATGGFGGTYPFMPREQLTQFKYFLPMSDLWSMAATFYNMLTGKHPLDFPRNRDPLEVLLRDEPVSIRCRDAAIPAALAAVLDRGLLSNPLDRYQTAAELKCELHDALAKAGCA